MELGQLRAIRELGDRGSIAAVAAALRVTASSISQQISALQRTSSVPLTYKSGRRTALTDAGRMLAAAAVDVEVALARAENAVTRYQDDGSAPVSVAAFHSAAMSFFGRLLSGAELGQPIITVHDFDVAQDDFPALTARHDLVIAHRLIGSAAWPAGVRVDPLMFEPLDIAVRQGSRLAQLESIRPQDLVGENWISVHDGFPLEAAVTMIATIAGHEAVIRHRINDFSIAASVVAATDCVALIPRYTTDLDLHPEVVLRPLQNPGIGRQIDCLSRPETLERSNAARVLDRLRMIATDVSASSETDPHPQRN